MQKIPPIGVAGAGTMGQGIVHLALAAGHSVLLYDISPIALEKARASIARTLQTAHEKGLLPTDPEACLARLRTTTSATELQGDLVIEAVVEKLEVKQELFRQVESVNSESCILATNTSSIPVTQIAAGCSRPNRVVGMHFFNPAHIMKLVEVIPGESTDALVVETIFSLCTNWGKVPVLAKDSPGFIVNRVARHYYVEALKLAEEQNASLASIDVIMEGLGFRMGPFRLMDLIGVDTNFSVTSTMYAQFFQEPRFRPSRLQQQKVLAGHHGKKTGKGFYDYS
jgi:3-hydroxybutyryl-CoA dehydrogenase